jgi:hypothetical protein
MIVTLLFVHTGVLFVGIVTFIGIFVSGIPSDPSMTIETAHNAPEVVIDSAEEIHDFLATRFGRDNVLLEVESSGAVQTTINQNAGVEYSGEWDTPQDIKILSPLQLIPSNRVP